MKRLIVVTVLFATAAGCGDNSDEQAAAVRESADTFCACVQREVGGATAGSPPGDCAEERAAFSDAWDQLSDLNDSAIQAVFTSTTNCSNLLSSARH